MADKTLVELGKFLSLILRHHPEKIGLSLDENGWADVSQLITLARKSGIFFTDSVLEKIVDTNDKKRYSFNADKSKIRASQGHSIKVDLDLIPQQPPNYLFHGTATRFIDSICNQGLLAMSRQHVHLSADQSTALKVGKRHGNPVILRIRAEEMYQGEFVFFCSDNGVWLTELVPSKYIDFLEAK